VKRPCIEPRCPNITDGTRCDHHQREYDARDRERRGSASDRGYDAQWRKATAGYLKLHPWCERTENHPSERVRSTVVGHCVAFQHGGDRLNPSNWIALCHSCNGAQAVEDNSFSSPTPPLKTAQHSNFILYGFAMLFLLAGL
jgi:5-methylcytosine-specific restriction protein A